MCNVGFRIKLRLPECHLSNIPAAPPEPCCAWDLLKELYANWCKRSGITKPSLRTLSLSLRSFLLFRGLDMALLTSSMRLLRAWSLLWVSSATDVLSCRHTSTRDTRMNHTPWERSNTTCHARPCSHDAVRQVYPPSPMCSIGEGQVQPLEGFLHLDCSLQHQRALQFFTNAKTLNSTL